MVGVDKLRMDSRNGTLFSRTCPKYYVFSRRNRGMESQLYQIGTAIASRTFSSCVGYVLASCVKL